MAQTSSAVEPLQARSLRNLYFARTAVQLTWAAAVISTALKHPALGAGLLVFYPLWDVACTIYDLRSATDSRVERPTAQYVNAAAGVLATLGIAATAFRSPQHAVILFGAWALAAGLAQLVVGGARRAQMGGQWAMMLSGLQSAAAGIAYILGGLHNTRHIDTTGGYAIFGGTYFLIAGLLMHRRLTRGVARGKVTAAAY